MVSLVVVVTRQTTACHSVFSWLLALSMEVFFSASRTCSRGKRNRSRCQIEGSTQLWSNCNGSASGSSSAGGRALEIRVHHS